MSQNFRLGTNALCSVPLYASVLLVLIAFVHRRMARLSWSYWCDQRCSH